MATSKGNNSTNNNNNNININNHQILLQHHHHQQQQNQISFEMMQQQQQQQQSSTPVPGNFISNKDSTGAYDLGELDQALFLYLEGQQDHHHNHQHHPSSAIHHDHQKQSSSGIRPPTLNIFPSQPMHVVEPSTRVSAGVVSPSSSGSKRQSEPSMALANPRNDAASGPEPTKVVKGLFFGGGAVLGEQGLPVGIKATVFDMEYARWLEEHHRLMCELQAAVQEHLPENDLRLFVDNCLAHYDEMMVLKSMIVKSDVFHLFSGMWKTPAERCFMWIGGFRPSELIKIVLNHIEPLTEQQILGICGLQQSTQEAEEALNQGLDALNQSLSDTIASDALSYPSNMANYMGQMAMAMNKISALEGFVRQTADPSPASSSVDNSSSCEMFPRHRRILPSPSSSQLAMALSSKTGLIESASAMLAS
ncbi:hypothetical protein Syun_002215 [Stephania yunnanensis]|uniref:DOG1 domain-containing protein n=1 Tax=Stephania yunnanensis TaxID=152371 RepID=A0AAP0LG39_9MAGN